MKSKVVLYELIRLVARDERLGVRALAGRFRVHRREVRAALASPVPAVRKVPVRLSPLTGPHHVWIRAVLVADLDAPVKQRHTAKRIRERLAVEYNVLVGESTCRIVVARIRDEITADGKRSARVVFVPQTRLPGAEGGGGLGQVHRDHRRDFYDVVVVLDVAGVFHSGVSSGVCERGPGIVHRCAFPGVRPFWGCAAPGPAGICSAEHIPASVPGRVMWRSAARPLPLLVLAVRRGT